MNEEEYLKRAAPHFSLSKSIEIDFSKKKKKKK